MQALKQGVARRRPLEDSEINHVRRDVGRIVSRHDAETIRQTVLPNEAFGIAPRSGEHLEPKGRRRIAVLAPAHSTVSATTGITIENFFDVRSTKTFESLGAL